MKVQGQGEDLISAIFLSRPMDHSGGTHNLLLNKKKGKRKEEVKKLIKNNDTTLHESVPSLGRIFICIYNTVYIHTQDKDWCGYRGRGRKMRRGGEVT